jgi:DNA-binding transcriptional ArsR family regulator
MVSREEMIRLCKLLKMKSGRDIGNTSVIIFRTVLTIHNDNISSSIISHLTGMHRLTVRHHLEKMKEMGFLEEDKGKYSTKFDNLRGYIKHRKKIMLKVFDEMEQIAECLDKEVEQENTYIMGEIYGDYRKIKKQRR